MDIRDRPWILIACSAGASPSTRTTWQVDDDAVDRRQHVLEQFILRTIASEGATIDVSPDFKNLTASDAAREIMQQNPTVMQLHAMKYR
jgi:hypothetical protein